MTYQEMTSSRWLQKVLENAAALRELVANYHPSTRVAKPFPVGPITAPAAEMACENVREMIRNRETDDPLTRWDKAIVAEDVGTLISLLEGAWFGVPESTGCWNIPGFNVAVDLLDDPPEADGGIQ